MYGIVDKKVRNHPREVKVAGRSTFKAKEKL